LHSFEGLANITSAPQYVISVIPQFPDPFLGELLVLTSGISISRSIAVLSRIRIYNEGDFSVFYSLLSPIKWKILRP
jgi:hypothetical protein